MTARLTNIDASTFNVVNTVSETEIVSLVMPAYGFAAGRAARLTVGGQLLNNVGTAQTFTFKVKLGSTTVLTSPAISLATSANGRTWQLETIIASETDDIQKVSGLLVISAAGTTTMLAGSDYAIGYGTAAEDGTGTVDVSVTVTLGSASANLTLTKRMGLLEQLGQVSVWTAGDLPALRAVSVGVSIPQASAVIT